MIGYDLMPQSRICLTEQLLLSQIYFCIIFNSPRKMENQYFQWQYGMMPANYYFGTYQPDHTRQTEQRVQNLQFVPYTPYLLFNNLNKNPENGGSKNQNEGSNDVNEPEKYEQPPKQEKRGRKRKLTFDIKVSRKIQKRRQKKIHDPDFKLNRTNKARKIDQLPDRNQFSNCFRAFFKMLANKLSSQKYRKMFERIRAVNGLRLEYDQFEHFFHQQIPVCNNYINQNQFLKLYRGDEQSNVVFRIIFNHFTKTDGVIHILLAGNKKKIMRQSIMGFLSAIRRVQAEIDSQNKTKLKQSK